jgi:DNA methylase
MNSKQNISWSNEKRKLSDLIPWERNPRQIRDKQAKLLAESFNDFGQVETIAISPDSDIYNGHQRLSVLAGQYGMDYEVDVRVSSRALSEKERERLTVYLHRGATGEWNWDELANWDMGELLEWGFEEKDFPFDVKSFDEGNDTEPQIDKAEELRAKWNVELGQMWQLGEHKIICGDCTDRAVAERVMGDKQIETLFFDPEWDNMPPPPAYKNALVFTDGGRIGDSVKLFGSPAWLFTWDCVSCWYTPNRPLKRTKHCLWYGDVKNYNFNGSHYGDAGKERTVWNSRGEYTFQPDARGKHLADLFSTPITQLHAESEHNHSKPLDWIRMLISNCTTGDVFDGFCGSGVSIVACEQLKRQCRAVEISPAFVAVSLQWFYDEFGITPQLC